MAELASPPRPSVQSRVWRWIDSRLGLDSLAYPIPAHANNVLYTLGGITLFGIVVLVGSGIYLTQFYHADPTQARQSIDYIITTAALGEYVRGLHFWLANLVVVTLLLHAVRVFATGSYRAPRELNWVVGVGMLSILLGLVFTGTVLKWDQEGWEALQHNQEIGELLGGAGVWFTPEFTDSTPILQRLFIAHIAILPFLLFGLALVHLLLIKRHGISARPGEPIEHPGHTDTREAMEREGSLPFTSHLVHIVGWGLLVTAVASLLALLVGAPLGDVIDPGVEKTKPLWMFLPLYPFEDWFSVKALLWIPSIGVPVLALVPLIDRFRSSAYRARAPLLAAGAVVFVALVALGIYGRFEKTAEHVPGVEEEMK
ncbi:MAG: cytochrome b N-terminal domain-containing protein [Chloroflexi bacterium]|nr:cytochrome b N-terminal domain-containing protein [Chloroflexota bacterium]